MFNLRMFRLHGEGKYIDMLERALYNTVLDGYGIGGKNFYYPNRLASGSRGDARAEWFGTSCCPTNLCRLIPSVPGYIYATDDDTLYWNLFVASKATARVGGTAMDFTVTGAYPYKVLEAGMKDQLYGLLFRSPGLLVALRPMLVKFLKH